MPEVSVDIQVYCAGCGEGLCNQTDSTTGRHGAPQLRVTPCEHCLDEARDQGDDQGYDRGLVDGKAEGSE